MSNLDSVKAVYQAFAKADILSVIGFLSPDIDWTEAEGFPYGGTYHGPNAVLSWRVYASGLRVEWIRRSAG